MWQRKFSLKFNTESSFCHNLCWNSTTNTLEVGTVAGTFALGEYILGKSSGASHKLRLLDTDPLDDGFADNKTIETVADTILDFTEGNPFGNP